MTCPFSSAARFAVASAALARPCFSSSSAARFAVGPALARASFAARFALASAKAALVRSSFSFAAKEARSYERLPSLYYNGRNDGAELPWFRYDLPPLEGDAELAPEWLRM